MNRIAIIGSGGREHALGWNIGKSNLVDKVLFLPGNGGTNEGKGENIKINFSVKNFHMFRIFQI